jgi:RNA polymerase sigma factor (sigma-70 family)
MDMEAGMETKALVTAAAGGDQAAWDALVARFGNLLWSIARSYRLSPSDAGDAVQTTWLKLVENIDRIVDPDRLPGWLATTARRECLQLIRRSRRDVRTVDTETLADHPDPAPPVDHAMLVDERDSALWRALTRLSEKCQRLLRVLMASPPPAYTEVAAALDLPIGTIGPARQRCLQQLRKVADADELLGADGDRSRR